MRFRCNVLITVNCVLIKTDPYKNYYATFKRECWHASVQCPLALQLKVYQLLNKETVTRSRDVLFVSELQYGATNVDQSPSELLTSTPYVNCMSRMSATK